MPRLVLCIYKNVGVTVVGFNAARRGEEEEDSIYSMEAPGSLPSVSFVLLVILQMHFDSIVSHYLCCGPGR